MNEPDIVCIRIISGSGEVVYIMVVLFIKICLFNNDSAKITDPFSARLS